MSYKFILLLSGILHVEDIWNVVVLSGKMVISENHVIMWMYVGKDHYNNVDETREPAESLSPAQEAFDYVLIFLL